MVLSRHARAAMAAFGIWIMSYPVATSGAERGVNEPDDAVIVTARKMPERPIDVPGSLSVIAGADFEDGGLRAFADLAGVVPNVAMSGGIAGRLQGQLAIRGIATLVRNIGVESGVGIYVDGAYVGRPDAYDQELLDVAQVEILRGPQGTIFGKNTIAGVFNIATSAPTTRLSGEMRVEAGDYGLARAQASMSGPVAGEALTARMSVGYVSRDGFNAHVSAGRDSDSLDLLSWRGAVALKPSASLVLTLRTDGLHDRGTPGFYSATDLPPGAPASLPPHRTDSNRPDRLRRDIAGLSLTATGSLGDAELTSITAYRDLRYAASLDDDQRQLDFLAADDFADRTEIWTQELRLSGKPADTVNLLAGVYLLDQTARTDRALAIGSALGIAGGPRLTTRGSVSTHSYAAFGNVDWRVGPGLTLSAGLRYTHERKRARFVQDDETGIFTFLGLPDIAYAAGSVEDDVSPTASLSIAAGPTARLYARVARGFKSASFNVDLAPSANGLSAGPEHATTYEAGVKAELFGRRAIFALAGFHTDYTNLQVSQITGGGTILSNAGAASIDGFEAELTAEPWSRVRIEGSAGYADARYDRFDNCAVPLSEGGGAANCAGKRLTAAPRFTAHGAAEYALPVGSGDLVGRIEARHQSSVYFEPTNSQRFRGRARVLLNARLSFRAPGWRLSAWVENLTDEVYETYRDDRTAVGVLRTTAYGPPRTFGFSASKAF